MGTVMDSVGLMGLIRRVEWVMFEKWGFEVGPLEERKERCPCNAQSYACNLSNPHPLSYIHLLHPSTKLEKITVNSINLSLLSFTLTCIIFLANFNKFDSVTN